MTPRLWFGIGLLTLALFLVGCSGAGGATPTASPIPTPIYHRPDPTIAAPTFSPTPLPTPDASALEIRPCLAEDLVVQFERGDGQTGTPILYFGVQNVSGDACRVHGPPTLELIPGMASVPTTGAACGSRASSNCPNVVTVLEPGPASGPYAAYFSVSYNNPIRSGQTCEPGRFDLAIDLPDGGGMIFLDGTTIPSCSKAGVSEFELAPTPTPVVTPDPTVGYR